MTWEYPPVVYGGLGDLLSTLAPAQVRLGHQVGVLALAHDVVTGAPVGGAAPLDGVRLLRVPLAGAPTGPWSGADLLTAAGVLADAAVEVARSLPPVDGEVVVHSHDWMTADAGRAVAEAVGARWVHAVHATEFGRRHGRLDGDVPRHVHARERAAVQAFTASGGRRPDIVLVHSEAMRTEVVGVLGADPSRVRVVPAAVDATRWVAPPADVERARGLWAADGAPLVVCAGRLEWEKGVSTVLRALPAVVRRHPRVRLVVAGAGSYEPTLRALADEVGVADRVTWTGRLAHEPLRALLAVASVVAVTSRYEPFGLVARQAQAAGAAVVVTDVGGLADAVEHEVTGLKVAQGDVDDLAVQVGRLLSEPRRAATLGEAGRAAAQAFSPDDLAREVLASYGA